jgi:hypothetical protein
LLFVSYCTIWIDHSQIKIHPYVNLAWQVLSTGMKVSESRTFRSFSVVYNFSIRWSKPTRLETSRFWVSSRLWRTPTRLLSPQMNWRTILFSRILSNKYWCKRLNVGISFRNLRDAILEVRGKFLWTKWQSELKINQRESLLILSPVSMVRLPNSILHSQIFGRRLIRGSPLERHWFFLKLWLLFMQ